MSTPEKRQIQDRRRLTRGGRRIEDLERHEDKHVTPAALALYLGVHRKTVIKWIRWGRLTAYHFPSISGEGDKQQAGEWRIRTVDAVAFVRRYRFQPGAEADSPESDSPR